MCAMHMIVSSQTNTLLIAFIRDYADFSGYSTIQQKWSFSCPQLAFLPFPWGCNFLQVRQPDLFATSFPPELLVKEEAGRNRGIKSQFPEKKV